MHFFCKCVLYYATTLSFILITALRPTRTPLTSDTQLKVPPCNRADIVLQCCELSLTSTLKDSLNNPETEEYKHSYVQ